MHKGLTIRKQSREEIVLTKRRKLRVSGKPRLRERDKKDVGFFRELGGESRKPMLFKFDQS